MALHTRTLLSFFVVTAVTAFVCCQPSRALAVDVPVNDSFAKAQVYVLSDQPFSTVGATTEPREPAHMPGVALPYHSVWFRYTPLLSGLYSIDTGGSNFDNVLAVYTGTAVNKLTRVAWDDGNSGHFTSGLALFLTKGVTYRIAIGGRGESDMGTGLLNLRLSHYYRAQTFQASFESTSKIDQDLGGMITFTTATSSAVTGRLYLGARSYPFITAATDIGSFSVSVLRPGLLPVTITAARPQPTIFPPPATTATFTLNDGVSVTHNASNLTCIIEIGLDQDILADAWPTTTLDPALVPYYSTYHPPYSVKNRCPREGRWPFTIGNTADTGWGVATLTVNYQGTCTAAGHLGDGTAFTFSAPMLDPLYGGLSTIENSGAFVFHLPLYGQKGRISGNATFSAKTTPHKLTGSVTWIRPAPSRGTVFLPGGIQGGGSLYGWRYAAPSKDSRIDPAFNVNDGVCFFQAFFPPYPDIVTNVTLTTGNTVTYAPPNANRLKLIIAPATGLLTGTVKFTGATALSPINAVLIHHPDLPTRFYGYVPGKTGCGVVTLGP